MHHLHVVAHGSISSTAVPSPGGSGRGGIPGITRRFDCRLGQNGGSTDIQNPNGRRGSTSEHEQMQYSLSLPITEWTGEAGRSLCLLLSRDIKVHSLTVRDSLDFGVTFMWLEWWVHKLRWMSFCECLQSLSLSLLMLFSSFFFMGIWEC